VRRSTRGRPLRLPVALAIAIQYTY
jgi:hypothetical protein